MESIDIKNKEAKNDIQYLNVMLETSCAEFGSALEMLIACKLSDQETFAYGYFEHAKDEYNHTKTFLSLLSSYGQYVSSLTAREYRFNSNSLITKGYLSSKGYLIETMNLKDFIAYVYTNELLAKESFEGILNLVNPNTSEGKQIIQIMDDELRHHGLAEKHFLKYYPRLQPWQLRLYRARETVKNYSRKFYDKNLKFLDKVLRPLYYFFSYLIGKVLMLIDLSEFNRVGKNLMEIKTKSVI